MEGASGVGEGYIGKDCDIERWRLIAKIFWKTRRARLFLQKYLQETKLFEIDNWMVRCMYWYGKQSPLDYHQLLCDWANGEICVWIKEEEDWINWIHLRGAVSKISRPEIFSRIFFCLGIIKWTQQIKSANNLDRWYHQ